MTEPTGRAERYDGRALDELARTWGVPRVEAWTRIGSTNDRARELAREGAPRGTTVVAEEQTAGRGRRGAAWVSAPGAGLWTSIVLDAQDAGPALPLVVGVACARAVEAVAAPVRVAVKWPNDLLVGGAKLGGILAEAVGDRVVVGVGINLRTPPGGFAPPLASIATALEVHAGKYWSPSDLADVLVPMIFESLDRPEPLLRALEELDARDALRDRSVDTEQAGPGVARGVGPTGALILERPDGARVEVVSGSVRIAE